MKLDAVLWDYDGTLVNSVPKNIDITKTILSIVRNKNLQRNFDKIFGETFLTVQSLLTAKFRPH